MSIHANDVLLVLKALKKSAKAKDIAEVLGTDSRAVATALRKPTNDGRIACTFKRKQNLCTYRFIREKAKSA